MVKILLVVFELIAIGVGFIFAYSQVILPIVRKMPLFPMFRRRPAIERELDAVNEQLEDKALQRELETKRRRLGKTSGN